MGSVRPGASKVSFAETFVLPAILIFLIPVISYAFFLHAQARFDSRARESVLSQIRNDQSLSADQRERATAFFTTHPFSELIREGRLPDGLDSTTRFHYFTFRWMIRLALFSIIGGVTVFVLTGICVLLSRHSQQVQYRSLSTGWQILRFYASLQAVIQGILLVALSFWITALWFEQYYVKLIVIAAALAAAGAGAVITAIYKKTKSDLPISGQVTRPDSCPRLWRELGDICSKVQTEPPEQIILGIDDNFFVTEVPVNVNGSMCHGRTLFISLSLLKQMDGTEAECVLAHEMAHFSGNDTLYTKKIGPLLKRYAVYLEALYVNPLTRPIFYFMNCFRALFELSLKEHSRAREFRADRIAAETISSSALASSLLRITAYSEFRHNIQNELFKHERVLQSANISAQIEQGFHSYASSFAAKPDIGKLETSHPFDSHPPLAQRLDAVGIPLKSQEVQSFVTTPGDGRWYGLIDGADELERKQWTQFEEQFRAYHEQSLAYRFLPRTDEEREIVGKAFPQIQIDGKKGSLILDCERFQYTAWPGTLAYGDVGKLTLKDGTLQIHWPDGRPRRSIPLKTFGKRQSEALGAIQRYYGRYLNAVAYQKQKQQESTMSPQPSASDPP